MDRNFEKLTAKIAALYRVYEDNAFYFHLKGIDKRIIVVRFEEDNTLRFVMIDRTTGELIDSYDIDFENQRELYEAVALRMFATAIGNVKIHKYNGNAYYNGKQKPYVAVISPDEKINQLIEDIVETQDEIAINYNHDIISNASKKFRVKTLEKSFTDEIDNRIKLTADFLKVREV